MITKFKERPCNTEFILVVLVDINKNTTINYMFWNIQHDQNHCISKYNFANVKNTYTKICSLP
jgi:hypothetical protein